tara:strand:+ start:1439 stop:1549 length:111 start_codon:yes stop_codon:yes gene_type:complete
MKGLIKFIIGLIIITTISLSVAYNIQDSIEEKYNKK